MLFLAGQLAYFVLLEGLLGATLGKLVMGLRVVKLDGSPYSWPAALIRNVLRFVDGLPVFYLVGLILWLLRRKSSDSGTWQRKRSSCARVRNGPKPLTTGTDAVGDAILVSRATCSLTIGIDSHLEEEEAGQCCEMLVSCCCGSASAGR